MSHLDNIRKASEITNATSNLPSLTFRQLLQEADASGRPRDHATGTGSSPPTLAKNNGTEEDHAHLNKRSVFAKVRAFSRNLKHSLSGRKKQGHTFHDDNTAPSWGITLDNGHDAKEPVFPLENYKKTARKPQGQRSLPTEKHVLESSVKSETEPKLPYPGRILTKSVSEKQVTPPKYSSVLNKHLRASKTISLVSLATERKGTGTGSVVTKSETADGGNPAVTGKGKSKGSCEIREHTTSSSPRVHDKCISVKEYLMQKFEPGENERALSQVISEAISARKASGDRNMVEKVRDVLALLLQSELPSNSESEATNSSSKKHSSPIANSSPNLSISKTSTHPSLQMAKSSSSCQIPISANAHQAEEETRERILQSN